MINKENDGLELCLHCGLCCLGYFHRGAVINNEKDFLLAQKMGAYTKVDKNNQQWFTLPCPKFDGKCSVYPERPSVCESHQCELLKSVKTGKIELEKSKSVCDEMKGICTYLDSSLNTVVSHKGTSCFSDRFEILFTLNDQPDIQKKHPKLFLKYAAYMVLKNRYFYHEENDFIHNI